MEKIRFIRTTHQVDGRFHPFSTEAYQFWHEYGWVVGEVLRHEIGMSFSEILQASIELIAEHPESELNLKDESYFAWCLVRLLEFGMVATIEDENP
ncbi:MAG: hypothetical protein IT327_03420 [Anaerolineae bacterium]|nr:hypothetical protein [Anaerolineae bacterium]